MADSFVTPSTSQEELPLSTDKYASPYHSCYNEDELPQTQGKLSVVSISIGLEY